MSSDQPHAAAFFYDRDTPDGAIFLGSWEPAGQPSEVYETYWTDSRHEAESIRKQLAAGIRPDTSAAEPQPARANDMSPRLITSPAEDQPA
jgi:hypothetical protein